MSDWERSESGREVSVPALGTRVCLLVAGLFVVLAVYLLLAPLQVVTAQGNRFDCGSAINGPDTKFASGICGSTNSIRTAQATAAGVAALVLAGGGFLAFGTVRRTQAAPRRVRSSEGDLG